MVSSSPLFLCIKGKGRSLKQVGDIHPPTATSRSEELTFLVIVVLVPDWIGRSLGKNLTTEMIPESMICLNSDLKKILTKVE